MTRKEENKTSVSQVVREIRSVKHLFREFDPRESATQIDQFKRVTSLIGAMLKQAKKLSNKEQREIVSLWLKYRDMVKKDQYLLVSMLMEQPPEKLRILRQQLKVMGIETEFIGKKLNLSDVYGFVNKRESDPS